MLYNANTPRESVTLSTRDLYAAHSANGHAAAMRMVRRAMTRAAVKADPVVMRDVHNAVRAAINTAGDNVPAATIRAAVNAAARAVLVESVRIAPATLDTDGKPYAPGMIRAAVMVARKTLVRACEHGGTDTQRAALQGLDVVNAAAVRYDVAGWTWEAAAPAILSTLATVSHDSQDIYAAAMAGIVNGYIFGKGKHAGESLRGTSDPAGTPREHIRAAYLSANLSMHAQRAATVRELSTEYVREQGGDVVAIGTAIARIIKGDERWTLSDVQGASRVDVEALREHLPRALALCRPVQREIAALLAQGYSVAAIADKTGRDRRTVQRNIAIMRGTCTEYIRANAPALLPMVKAAGYDAFAAAQENAAAMPRTEAGKAAKKAADKATQAERARRYRERKKAEKAAQAAAPVTAESVAADMADVLNANAPGLLDSARAGSAVALAALSAIFD